MNKLSPALTFLVEYMDIHEATGDDEAAWEQFQLRHLADTSLLRISNKSRQVGWSWLAAAEAVALALIEKRSTSIFVSINLDEAAEKIRYAKHIHEALDRSVQQKVVRDNRLELEFANGSRLISHPCRPVRGKARARVYLDEFAHYPNDREIYQSAVPVITKGGTIRIGSSPLGATGLFWDIYTQSTQAFPGYARQAIPWWRVSSLCNNGFEARLLAPKMLTKDRVMKYGTPRLIQIFENMVFEDFQQEYECSWLDESVSWIDWELIKRNQVLAAQDRLYYRRALGIDNALMAIEEVYEDIHSGKVEDQFAVGMDIGRVHDRSEIIAVGINKMNMLPYRLHITLDRVEFDDQEAVLSRLLTVLPVSHCLIDGTGMGMQLAENMNRIHGDRAQGVGFTAEKKQLWAIETKLRLQRGELPIPMDRDFSYQIHSLKRKVTDAKTLTIDVSRSEKHHADMFWAWALAVYAAKSGVSDDTGYGANPTAGYRG